MAYSAALGSHSALQLRVSQRASAQAIAKPKRPAVRAAAAVHTTLPSVRRPWECTEDSDEQSCRLGPDVEEKAMHLQQLSSHFANEPYEAVRARLHSVLVLLPDLASRVAFHNAEELDRLMQDPDGLAESLLKLEEIFPGQDISQLVVADTRLADPAVVAALPEEIEKVKALLGVPDVAELFRRRPLLLDSRQVVEALVDLEEMLPEGYDAQRMLVNVPALIYPANRKCLPSQLIALQGDIRHGTTPRTPAIVDGALQVHPA